MMGSSRAFKIIVLAVILCCCILFSHSPARAQQRGGDRLSSWNDGPARQAIVDFVAKVTNPLSPGYVPQEERVATFDLDGTLIPEKPYYIQVAFMAGSIRAQAAAHPEWKSEQPFKAILEDDVEYLGRIKTPEVMKLLLASYPGLTLDHYRETARAWIKNTRHPRFDFTYGKLVYAPMAQLMAYLQEAGFRVYICSGSTTEFIDAFSCEALGIPPMQILGSRLGFEFREDIAGCPVVKKPQVVLFNDRGEKPVNLQLLLGKRPLIAVGNSNGDLETFKYVEGRGGPFLNLMLHHDDGAREYAYDQGADQLLTCAGERKWTIISMKRDFKNLFHADRIPGK